MTDNKKIILGFVGQIASGKGEAVRHLKEKHDASIYCFSTMLRDILDRLHLPQSRENLQKLSSVLRENFSQDILSKVIAEDISNDPNNLIVIDGIRRPADAKYIRELPGFVLVYIHTDIKTRYGRIVTRAENTDDRQKTFEEFKKDHEREAEQLIAEIADQALEKIDNDGAIEELHGQLDELIKKLSK